MKFSIKNILLFVVAGYSFFTAAITQDLTNLAQSLKDLQVETTSFAETKQTGFAAELRAKVAGLGARFLSWWNRKGADMAASYKQKGAGRLEL